MKIISIFTKPNGEIEEYLDILIKTEEGFFSLAFGELTNEVNPDLSKFELFFPLELLKSRREFDSLFLVEMKTTYDNDMYVFLSDGSYLISCFEPDEYGSKTIQVLTIIEREMVDEDFECFFNSIE